MSEKDTIFFSSNARSKRFITIKVTSFSTAVRTVLVTLGVRGRLRVRLSTIEDALLRDLVKTLLTKVDCISVANAVN